MKNWILPSIAVGAVVFLMTKPGRQLQERIAGNLGDWSEHLLRSNQRLQETLEQVQNALNHFNRALQQVSD